MSARPKVLLVDGSERTTGIRRLLQTRGFKTRPHDIGRPASRRELSESDVAVISVDWSRLNGRREDVVLLINTLAENNIATLVIGVPDDISFEGSLIDQVPSGADLKAHLDTFARYAPMVRKLDRELEHLQRLGKRLNHHFTDIDQEMRLAGRLQRDFLPRQLPQTPPLTFESLYRPATWVSGDIYDVFRIDERHIGMFVCDAVGHGIAAGLLTMFVRNALRTKYVSGTDYNILEPVETIACLHDTLLKQALPNCWFVTASYIVIDTISLELRHARGGHPFPLHVSAAGEITELRAAGGLLGVPDIGSDFEQDRVALNAGDKIILYSDGVEHLFVESRCITTLDATFNPKLLEWVGLPAKHFIERLGEHLDREEGSLHPADDVTVVVLEVAG